MPAFGSKAALSLQHHFAAARATALIAQIRPSMQTLLLQRWGGPQGRGGERPYIGHQLISHRLRGTVPVMLALSRDSAERQPTPRVLRGGPAICQTHVMARFC
jgi:hypothetical protein